MTHLVARALAGALFGVSALAMSAQAQTVTNPLQKPAPANERGGQGDRGNAKDATSQQQPGLKQNERDAKDTQASNQAGSQSGPTNRNTSSQQSGENQNTQNQNNSASNQSSAGRQNGTNQQGNQQNSRDDRDTRRDSSSAREHTAMKPTDMRGPDIGLWFNRGNRDGLVISDVSTRGPIAHLGFREGDRIVSVNGHRVSGESEFINYLLTSNDSRVAVIVTRDGRDETIYVEPTQFTEDYNTPQVEPLEQFGVVLDDRYDDRIVVWRVIPRSPAYYAGIREGDVISTFGDRPYKTRTEFETSVRDMKAGEANLQVRRGDKTRDLSVDVPEFERGAGSKEQSTGRGDRGASQQGDSRTDDNHADNNRATNSGAGSPSSGQPSPGPQNGAQPNSGQQSDSQQGVSPAKKATSGGWKEGR
jgi:C-terminal processing protease CtpA/Prc